MKGKRILLIEDNKDIQEFVSTIARLEGAELTVAGTGEDGLAELKRTPPPDVVLLDLNLPGIQGWDVLEELRKEDASLPVVVFSAFIDADTRERAMRMGANGFISKPVGAREFVQSVTLYSG
jgi:CheY-like chemotaxis protein